MSDQTLIYLVLGVVGVGSLGMWVGLVVVPAVTSYQRIWERMAASFLGVYVFLALVVIGVLVFLPIFWYYDEL
jgi:hypothetical protein